MGDRTAAVRLRCAQPFAVLPRLHLLLREDVCRGAAPSRATRTRSLPPRDVRGCPRVGARVRPAEDELRAARAISSRTFIGTSCRGTTTTCVPPRRSGRTSSSSACRGRGRRSRTARSARQRSPRSCARSSAPTSSSNVPMPDLTAAVVAARLGLDDSYLDWLAALTACAPATSASLPSASDADELLARLGVRDEDRRAVLEVWPTEQADPELWWLLERSRARLIERDGRRRRRHRLPVAPGRARAQRALLLDLRLRRDGRGRASRSIASTGCPTMFRGRRLPTSVGK